MTSSPPCGWPPPCRGGWESPPASYSPESGGIELGTALYHDRPPDHRRRGPVRRGAGRGRVRRADPRGWGGAGGPPAHRPLPHRPDDGGVYAPGLRSPGAGRSGPVPPAGPCGHPRPAPAPDAGAAHQRLRRPGGGGGAHPVLRPGLLSGPGGGGDAGLHRDHLLHHRRLLRVGGYLPHPVRHPGRSVRRPHRLSGRRLGGAAVLRRGLRNSPSNHGRNWGQSCTFPCK